MKELEMWGSIEGSPVPQDLRQIQELGLKTLRFPCLWEKVAPKELDRCHWSHLDEQLNELKKIGQDFIAEFLHHESAPVYTSFIDPDFPEKLSTFARYFAQRYPWVQDFTPLSGIHETARASYLHGHWYPHLKNDLYYLKAVIHQCKATVLAMREIRIVNPKARLIQTEDVGRFQSTPELRSLCELENHRRWLGLDLLCGEVDRHHPLYAYMREAGIREDELTWFQDNSCPPDMIGIGQRQTSHRFLDHRLELYPEWLHHENSMGHYADLNAGETGEAAFMSPEASFAEVWNRYRLPIAITDIHLSGHREDQMRWLNRIWKAASDLRDRGADIRSVTVWNSHSTPLSLAKLIRELRTQGAGTHPTLFSEGIWETPRRMNWGIRFGEFTRLYHRSDARPVLIAGAPHPLRQALIKACGTRNIAYQLLQRGERDLTDKDSIEEMIQLYKPWAIINAMTQPEEHALHLAKTCSDNKISFLNFSSTIYQEAEEKLLAFYPEALIVRTDASFSPMDNQNLVNECLNLLIDEEKGVVHLADGSIPYQQEIHG